MDTNNIKTYNKIPKILAKIKSKQEKLDILHQKIEDIRNFLDVDYKYTIRFDEEPSDAWKVELYQYGIGINCYLWTNDIWTVLSFLHKVMQPGDTDSYITMNGVTPSPALYFGATSDGSKLFRKFDKIAARKDRDEYLDNLLKTV